MVKRSVLLTLGLLVCAVSALHLGYDAVAGQLTDLTAEGYTRRDETGGLRAAHSLVEHGWVYASPTGEYLLIAEFHSETFPTVADLRLLDARGDVIWSKRNQGFASAVVSNDGRVAMVEFFGTSPIAPAKLTLLDPAGSAVTERDIQPLGAYRFSVDGALFAVNIAGEELAVLETARGEQIGSLPSSQTFVLGPGGAFVLLAEAGQVLRHDLADNSVTTIETGVAIPRWFSEPLPDGGFALAGMNDVFTLHEGVTRYARLPEGHSIASLDVTGDFSVLALGSYIPRSPEGAVWLLDGGLNIIESHIVEEERLGGPWPQVLLTPDRLWIKTNEGLTSFAREE